MVPFALQEFLEPADGISDCIAAGGAATLKIRTLMVAAFDLQGDLPPRKRSSEVQ
jgi:hypothetical protein